jgi:hypothetical protein
MFGIRMIFGPQTPVVRLNNGPANIEAHPHPILFGTEEGLKHPRDHGFCNSSARIGDLDTKHAWEGAGLKIGSDSDGWR